MEIQDLQRWDKRVQLGGQPALFALGTFVCHRFFYKHITPLKVSQSVVTTVVNSFAYVVFLSLSRESWNEEAYTSPQWLLRSKVFICSTAFSFFKLKDRYFVPILKLSSLHFLTSLGLTIPMNKMIQRKEEEVRQHEIEERVRKEEEIRQHEEEIRQHEIEERARQAALKAAVKEAYKEGRSILGNMDQAINVLKEIIREEWEEKLPISDQHRNAVRAIWHQVEACQSDLSKMTKIEGVTWKNKNVFILDAFPDLVFKRVGYTRFEKVVEDHSFCIIHQLTHLVVPCTQPLKINWGDFIVQERLDVDETSGNQEFYYQEYAGRLKTAVGQLMTYIVKTHESDVEWRNCPVLGDPKTTQGPLKIALVDHDLKESFKWGILGHQELNRRGLIGLLGRQQAQKVAEMAKRYFSAYAVEESLNKRLGELDEAEQLKKWYASKNIQINSSFPLQDRLGIANTFNQAVVRRSSILYHNMAHARRVEMSIPLDLVRRLRTNMPSIAEEPNIFLREDENEHNRLLRKWEQEVLKALKDQGIIFSYKMKSELLKRRQAPRNLRLQWLSHQAPRVPPPPPLVIPSEISFTIQA